MTSFFADTFYWIALTNPRDSFHESVLSFSRSLRSANVFTTDEVLVEFLTYCASDPSLRTQAVSVVEDILRDGNVNVIPQTRSSFLSGLDLYRSRPDKAYSFTDCISMQTMRRTKLLHALTNDIHFQQEGLQAVFRVN